MIKILDFQIGDFIVKKLVILIFSFLYANSALAACDDFRLFSVKTFRYIETLALKEVKKLTVTRNIDLAERELTKFKLFYENAEKMLQEGKITIDQLKPYKLDLDESQLAVDVANSDLDLVDVEVEYATAVLDASCTEVQVSVEQLRDLARSYVTKWRVKTRHGVAKQDVATRRSAQAQNNYLFKERLAGRGTIRLTELAIAKLDFEKSVIEINLIQKSRVLSRNLLDRFVEIENSGL